MNNTEKSRRFWERAIGAIEVAMFIGMAALLYFTGKTLSNFGIDVGPVTGIILQIAFVGLIIYMNKVFMEELDRRLPIPKRNYYTE